MVAIVLVRGKIAWELGRTVYSMLGNIEAGVVVIRSSSVNGGSLRFNYIRSCPNPQDLHFSPLPKLTTLNLEFSKIHLSIEHKSSICLPSFQSWPLPFRPSFLR